MATEYTAVLSAALTAEETFDATVDPGATGAQRVTVKNSTNGRRWSNGQGSGQIGACYKRLRTIGSGATDTYDVLAAGSLTTPSGAAIDLDELKGMALKCTSGEVKLMAAAASGLACFTGASEGLLLKASGGLRSVVLDFGPDGLDVTTNSQFSIVETSSSATAAYELAFIGAE